MLNSTIIFHPYSLTRPQEQLETWKALDCLNRMYPVYHHLCNKPDDYDKGLACRWNKGYGLVIVEQDIVPTPDMIMNLVHSQALMAAQAYYLYTLENEPVIAHRCYIDSMATRWIEPEETQAHLIGLGLTYFSKEAQSLVDLTTLSHNRRWDNLDIRLSQAFYAQGLTFNIHYPVVTHNHRKAPDNYRGLCI